MKEDQSNSLYDKFLPMWTKCRVVSEGSEAVKEAGTTFLPQLSGQEHQAYTNYKNRALFYEATTRTINGMLGMLFSKSLRLSVDPEDPIYQSIFSFYNTLPSFLRMVAKEIVTTGRGGLLVDADADGNSYITYYRAEDIRNWRTIKVKGIEVLSFISLVEEEEEVIDLFTTEKVEYLRVLWLNVDLSGNLFYQQSLYRKLKKASETKKKGEYEIVDGFPMTPQINGVPFETIPFYFAGATGNFINPVRPPIIGLVNVNISHYMNSADLEHGRHFTGLPTPWAAGFHNEGDKLEIGSQVAWVSNNPDAKAGYLEFTGQGLQSLETALKEKQEMMVILGARLLETPKKISESSENQETRRQGEMSILSNIAVSLSNAISEALTVAANWRNDRRDFKVEISKDFNTSVMDPQKLNALISAIQSGVISFDTFFYNLQNAGIIPDTTKKEDELLAIDETMNNFNRSPEPTPTDPPPNDPTPNESE